MRFIGVETLQDVDRIASITDEKATDASDVNESGARGGFPGGSLFFRSANHIPKR